MPTTQPSSAPTIEQTKVIKSNEFINTSAKEVQIKVKYYMVSFCGYFVGLYLLILVLDKSGVGKGLLNRLHDSAYHSNMYKKDGTSDRKEYLETLPIRNKLNQLAIEDQFVATLFDSMSTKNMRKVSKKLGQSTTNAANGATVALYDEAFYQYLLQRRCLLGCSGLLYPGGLKLNLLVTSYHLREGMYEDFILFLCNNHSLLSCIYRVGGSPISRNACRILYLVQNSIAFFISALNSLIFAYFALNANYSYVTDVVFVAPISIFLGSVILGLYTCRVVNTVEFTRGSCGKYGRCIAFMGRLMVFPFIVLMFLLLILAAVCTSSDNVYSVILSFVWQVQLQSIVLEFVYALALFNSSYFYQLRVLGIPVVEVGSIFAERVLKCIQPEYYMYYTNMMGGFMAVDMITHKIVPNKVEVTSAKPKDVYVAQVEAPNDRATLTYDYYDDKFEYEMSPVCSNPLYATSDASAIVPPSELTIHSSFSNEYSDNDVVSESPLQQAPQFNPLHALRRPLSKPRAPSITDDVDTDASLMAEFHEFQLQQLEDNSAYAMSSFEDWKIKRKELKEGIDENYKNAFRFFERKEQEVGVVAPKVSSSVARVMGLHTALDAKSNPLTRKPAGNNTHH